MGLQRSVISLLVIVFLVGCEGNNAKPAEKRLQGKDNHDNQQVDIGKVSGNLMIIKGAVLPEDVDITVTLADTSFTDLPALILSQKHYNQLNNKTSLPFELTYHKNEIRKQARVMVSATVYGEGKLLYISDSSIEVINNGITENIDILLVPAN
ncbi:endopeptidase [Providencia rustigianii]|uniref:YbaY family lipoprotein n=1 Tax=Providencia rustigianii TaxID=158850 RepID=UPI000F702A45|nr:YbaY family lipoprotein [Providencia rustigianii]MTC60158.1 endopeptidase [Providencia rustigianii]VEH54150.1 Uncharacterised protein [Providencia rustigianii]